MLFKAADVPLSFVTPALVVSVQLIPVKGVVENGFTKLPMLIEKLAIVALPKVPKVTWAYEDVIVQPAIFIVDETCLNSC